MIRTAALLVSAILSVASLLVPASASAATATKRVVASDDATVISSLSTRNFGNDTHLRVDASPITHSYLKFNLSSITGTITAAVRLVPSASAAAGFDVRTVASASWTESTLTYVNRPSVGNVIAHSPSALKAGVAISFNVTTSVKAGIRAFALTDRGSSLTLFLNSSEASSAARRPTLVITSTLPPPPSPCGTSASPVPTQHVIWIFMENHGYSQVIGSAAAPFETRLARQCGLAANMHAETHPSLPNYISATSGDPQGIADDAGPDVHPLRVASIFSQVKDAGKTWRAYEESSIANCPAASSNPYAVKHDPAAYYTGIHDDCVDWDIPMGTTSSGNFLNDLNHNTLPAFAFVTPNLCSDTHDCPVATGDAWLSGWIAKIVASPGYRDGSTVIFLTWDEDEGAESNRIPTIVVSPSTHVGTVSSTSFSHYSMLKTTEELLGIRTFIGHAGDPETTDMRTAFNL